MKKVPIAIVNLTAKGSGFAHRADTGDQVFIPSSVMRAAGVTMLGSYNAKLVPNQYRQDVPYMAVLLSPDTDEEKD